MRRKKMMKKVKGLMLIFLVLALFGEIVPQELDFPGNSRTGDRKRIFFLLGGGLASSNAQGPLVEAGLEVRVFGDFHARLIIDRYFGDNTKRNNMEMEYMYSAGLSGIYKLRVNETMDIRIKAGVFYSTLRARVTALDIDFYTDMADIGGTAGAGFSLQLNNIAYFYLEGEVKHLLLETPWTWAKVSAGVMFRLK